jgi:hypothetical protein
MTLTASQAEWLRVRSYLQVHRHALAVDAAGAYPADRRMAGTPLLTAPEWQPAAPIPLHDIELEFFDPRGTPPRTPAAVLSDQAGVELPERPDGTRYRSYSDALRDLAAPAVFENRPTYRLTEADLTKPRLAFTRGRYFDGVDTGEAAAHEFAATRLAGLHEHGEDQHRAGGPRARIADPCDLTRRPANLAITTLTLRFDATTGRASFLLHWRDPAKVGHAGGLYQVIPVGVFQPSGEASWHEREDFSLWRCMLREFDEELRGTPEQYGAYGSVPADYDSWPFARHMAAALDQGQVRVWCLGLGVDPLTYATDLLTVAVIDSQVFDELFSLDPRGNDEGSVLAAREFAAHVIDRVVTGDPVQAAGAAVLRLAWRHRDTLTVLPRRLVPASSLVDGEHDGPPGVRPEDAGQPAPHAPVERPRSP